MQPLRRTILAGVLSGLCALTLPARGQSAPRIDVAKVMSFSCSVCLAAESQDRLIAQEVRSLGGRFVWAPVPTAENNTGARERVYYAARDMDPAFGEVVKVSIYKGIQDRGLELNDFVGLYNWIGQDLDTEAARLPELFRRAQEASGDASVGRAARLAVNAGVQSLPTYIILVDGRIDTALDPTTTKSGSLAALREDVIARVQALSQPKKP